MMRKIFHYVAVFFGAVALTGAFFCVLPLFEVINKPDAPDLSVTEMNTADVPPPPPPPEEEKAPEKAEAEAEPPKLEEVAKPLDLSQLELALNPGTGGAGAAGDFAVNLNTIKTAQETSNGGEGLFALSDLDQKPRVVHQPSPTVTAAMRKKVPGSVQILFIVDQTGRVENPVVQSASDPVFERPALAAVKQWRFEPGKRNGQPVRFRMRVPMTFPQG